MAPALSQESKRASFLPSAAAVISVLAALTCCLPVGYILAAAGLASAGMFLSSARPYLVVLSVLLLAAGFLRTYAGKQCRANRSRASVALLWTASGLVFILLLFPQLVAGFLADLLPPPR